MLWTEVADGELTSCGLSPAHHQSGQANAAPPRKRHFPFDFG